jgi:deoxyribodipyrimidine photo-lyase
MKKAIVWFKTDLRLHDNETLVQAVAQQFEVIPVYCIDPKHYSTTTYGFAKTGSFRAQFILDSLKDLDKNLRDIGSGLTVVTGAPEVEIAALAKKFEVQKVFAKKEVATEERQTQDLVENALWKIKCTLETYSTSTLYHATDLPFSLKDIPDVFTAFRKKIEKETTVRKTFEKPTSLHWPALEPLLLPTIEQLGLAPLAPDNRAAMIFEGGESAALKRLNYYLFETKALSTYKETRNGMIGERYSSKLSAWLSVGCLSPREVYTAIKKYEEQFGANESTYWLVFELLWRDYFRFMMKKHGRSLFLKNGIKTMDLATGRHDAQKFNAWMHGQTGNDFIDANMVELKLTGFMSNRGRQNVASYLCNDLNLDWRYGAAYFEQQLIDYDACSNWGNWAYLAGVGNDPRGSRAFNIEKQANDYDKNKTYRNLWMKNN